MSRFAEDTDLGMRLCRKNLKILLNKEIEVIHLRDYSFTSFLRNDFIIPYYWAKIFIQQHGWLTLVKKEKKIFTCAGRADCQYYFSRHYFAGTIYQPFNINGPCCSGFVYERRVLHILISATGNIFSF